MIFKRLILTLFVVLGLALTANAQKARKMIVLPMEAIGDSARLNHSQFKKLYPGIDITEVGLIDEGWYIRYSHDGLVYMFGPSDDLDLVREQKVLLEQVRLAVVLQTPKLSASKVEIIKFEFNFDSPTGKPAGQEDYLIPEKN